MPTVSPWRHRLCLAAADEQGKMTMHKRVRKKNHREEFREWGVPIAMRRRHPDGCDDFLDDVVAQAIAAQGRWFGGGGHDDRLTGVIVVGRAAEAIEARVQHIRRWLEAREDIETSGVGPRVDLWHGPFDALDAIDERLPDRYDRLNRC